MSIKAVLFDLDGTLLPMDQDVFLKTYLGMLATNMATHGYEIKSFVEGIWQGTSAVIQNDGSRINEQVFWEAFSASQGKDAIADIEHFDRFYREKFDDVRVSCSYDPAAKDTVDAIKKLGLRVILATNPVFPAIATQKRMRWAGFEPEDFELYTTYENSHFCKPNPQYYMEIASKLGLFPDECLMVGNDVIDDMCAQSVGMKVFLLTNCLINKKNEDISAYERGGFEELIKYVRNLI